MQLLKLSCFYMLNHDDPCFLTFCNNVLNRISLSYLAEKVKNPYVPQAAMVFVNWESLD